MVLTFSAWTVSLFVKNSFWNSILWIVHFGRHVQHIIYEYIFNAVMRVYPYLRNTSVDYRLEEVGGRWVAYVA